MGYKYIKVICLFFNYQEGVIFKYTLFFIYILYNFKYMYTNRVFIYVQ